VELPEPSLAEEAVDLALAMDVKVVTTTKEP
jgi:hypothetical protein